MAENVKYGNILVSSRKDETLTYTKFVKDMDSGKSLPTLLDEKVGWTDQIRTDNLSDSSVTTPKLADQAVTTEKIAAQAVTTSELDDEAVTTNKLKYGAVTTDRIADQAVTTEKLKDSSVTTPKIADDAVTIDKLDDYVETTLLASVNRVDLSTELTDVDEAGEVRHMKICLRHTENTGSTFDAISPSLDTATTSHDGLMAGEDKQQLDAHEADLKAIHKVTDNVNTNYLRRDGSNTMQGKLVFDQNYDDAGTIEKSFSPDTSAYFQTQMHFKEEGIKAEQPYSRGHGVSGTSFIFTAYTTGFTAPGYYTVDQSYYGLLTNNGAVLAAMSDTDITSVANAVFGA